MKKEELTQEYLKSVLAYNRETGEFTWLLSKGKKTKVGARAGILHSRGYRRINIRGKQYYEQRLAWLYVNGSFPTGTQKYIDHINGDKSDNSFANLRICSQAENLRNTKKHSDNKSGFKGVYYNKHWGKYIAQIQNPLTGERDYLGGYNTVTEASSAYKAKALDYSGEFYPDKLHIVSS